MAEKSKYKYSILIIVVLCIAILFSLLKIYELSNHTEFYQNRINEYEYLRITVNNSRGDIDNFKTQWGDAFKELGGGVYLIEASDVVKKDFFKDNNYSVGLTDFYGYEFHFDETGELKSFYFYKP